MRICITGGTGSFGNAYVRAHLHDAERLVVLSRDELKQAEMAAALGEHTPLKFFLGDVRDRDRLVQAFVGCDTVIHGAALKRVDAITYNPEEVVKTNVLGTMNVVRAAIEAGVERVIIISSDKAVHATNIYGASKFLAEGYAISANSYGAPKGTRIAAVRYGNVAASRGSVLHVWRRQRNRGAPLTLTDARMTRFWLTLSQAVALVDTALERMIGGEVFVPILPNVRMTDVAEAVAPGHPLTLAGLRPGGEKLAEQLLSEEEVSRTLLSSGVYVITPSHRSWSTARYAGAPVTPDLVYRSDTGDWWLSIEEIRKRVGELE